MTHNNYIYIAVMALVSYAIRILPLTLIRKPIKNRFIQSFLYYVPYVTLAVMTFPAIIQATQSPAALPVRMENQYFALDIESPAAHEMLEQGVCMFYVPELLGALELELFAVLRS